MPHLLDRLYQTRIFQIEEKWMRRYPSMDYRLVQELALGEFLEEQQATQPRRCNEDD